MELASRVIFIRIDYWPIIALNKKFSEAVAVVSNQKVVCVSPLVDCVQVGMTQREAAERLPSLQFFEQDLSAEAKRFEEVIDKVEAITPWVDVLAPGEICLPASTPERFYGGELNTCNVIIKHLSHLLKGFGEGYESACKIGISEGTFSARLASLEAKPGQSYIVPKGQAREFLSSWPISALGNQRLASTLFQLGIKNIGLWAELEPSDVVARFGREGLRLHEVARAKEVGEGRKTAKPRNLSKEWVFEAPVLDSKLCNWATLSMAQDLIDDLESSGLTCVRLCIVCESESSETIERFWRFEGSSIDAADVAKRVQWQIEVWLSRVDGPTSGISRIKISPDQLLGAVGKQLSFWGAEPSSVDGVKRLVPRLGALVGEENVSLGSLRGGIGPAEQFEFVPAVNVDLLSGVEPDNSLSCPWPGKVEAPSPVVVAGQDLIRVLLTSIESDPIAVSARGELSSAPEFLEKLGVLERITKWSGPWLDSRNWWADEPIRKARIQVVTSVGAYLLVSVEQAWFVEASYW